MEKRIAIGLKLPPSLVAELDEARRALEFQPTRTEVIERLIRDFIDRSKVSPRKPRIVSR